MSSAGRSKERFSPPKLPGMSPVLPTGLAAAHFPRPHTLTFSHGSPVMKNSGEVKEIDERSPSPPQPRTSVGGDVPAGAPFVPRFVSMENEVLRWEGFIRETLPATLEGFRVRRVVITYFVLDDAIKVMEKKEENSGLSQGALLKRQRVPKPGGGGNVTWKDFRCGSRINLHGRLITLSACDEYTREFMHSRGVDAGEAVPIPDDPYLSARSESARSRQLPPKSVDNRSDFLINNRKVLRFYAVWDDESTKPSTRRFFTVHYFLQDGTIEVVEDKKGVDGRDPFPTFLSRQKLPLDATEYQLSALNTDAITPLMYTDADLRVGDTIGVFGRQMFLYNMDPFSRAHYAKTFGLEDIPDLTADVTPDAPKAMSRFVPPHNGYGSEADSLGNCFSLVPKPPRPNFAKILKYTGKVLRCLARFANAATPEDVHRRFVLSYYLVDDSISIFEPPVRNSGLVGGKYLERFNPKGADGKPLPVSSFAPGSLVNLNKFDFEIMECDKATSRFFESGGDVSVLEAAVKTSSEIMELHERIKKQMRRQSKSIRQAFRKADDDGNISVSRSELKRALQMLGVDLTVAEADLLMRHWDKSGDGEINYEEFAAEMAKATV